MIILNVEKKYTNKFLLEIILHELEILWARGLPEETTTYMICSRFKFYIMRIITAHSKNTWYCGNY